MSKKLTDQKTRLWKCYKELAEVCGFIGGFEQGYSMTTDIPHEKWKVFLDKMVSIIGEPITELKNILEEIENE